MPPLGPPPQRPPSRVGDPPHPSATTPSPWRGDSFLLSGGSLPLDASHQRRRRHSLSISLALQCALTALIMASLHFGPGIPPLPQNEQVTLLTFPLPPLRLATPTVVPPLRRPSRPRRFRPLPSRTPPAPPPPRPQPTPTQPHPVPAATLSPLAAAPPRLPSLSSPSPLPPPLKLGTFGAPHGLPNLAAQPVPAPALGNFGRSQAQPDPPDPPAPASSHSAGFGGPTAADPAPHPDATAAVHSAGFGAAPASSSAISPPNASVRLHNFGTPEPSITSAHPQVSQALPDFQPPSILAWPTPAYTADAALHHIQGDVVLQVRLGADGQVQVLHLVQGLGHGLDQAAMAAARQLRFRPARRRDQPVDWIVLLHIHFRLAY